MRLLALTNAFPPPAQGGYSEACSDVMQGLAARGHDVTVLSAADDSADSNLAPHGALRVRRALSPVLGAWRRPGPGHRARRRDEQVLADELRRGIDAVLVWHMRGIVKRPLRLAHARGIPVIYCLHDRWVLYERPGAFLLPWARLGFVAERLLGEPRILREGWVCFNSAWLREEHVRRAWRPRRTRLLPLGLDDTWFAPRREGPAARRVQRLVFAGRLDHGKGLDVALRAMAHLGDTAPFRLTIAGLATNAAEVRRLRSLSADLGLEERVTWLPPVPRGSVPALLARHDVGLYPSTTPESFGLGLLEAMAAGLVTITSARGAPEDWLEHERNALVHEPGDHIGLAAALSRLTEDGELAVRLREAGARTAGRFVLPDVLDATEALLEEATGLRGRPLEDGRLRGERAPAFSRWPGAARQARSDGQRVG